MTKLRKNQICIFFLLFFGVCLDQLEILKASTWKINLLERANFLRVLN